MKKRFFEWLIAWMMPGYHVHIHRTRTRKKEADGHPFDRGTVGSIYDYHG